MGVTYPALAKLKKDIQLISWWSDSIIERRPALFFLGRFSPIFAPFFAVFSRFSPS